MSDTGIITTSDGHWNASAIRKRKPLIDGAVWFGMKDRSWVFHNGNAMLGTVRRMGPTIARAWLVRVDGFEYLVTPDSVPARNGWPVGTYIPVKAFPTVAQAKKEVLRVLRSMPELGPDSMSRWLTGRIASDYPEELDA